MDSLIEKEARNWVSDCLNMSGLVGWPMTALARYIHRNYDGGWDSFVNSCGYPFTMETEQY
jgi:hypothetical protein